MRWRLPPTRSARSRAARCACGWDCTRASRSAADEGYVGLDVHRAARIAAAGHGGQVLLSQATVDLAGADVRDLGLHRLKDLSAPERLFQLGTDDFPPLKTLHETNLPVPATPFLGREREIDQIAALLRRPEVRLVTLTGPGGSGKTRLALQAAAAAADDYDRGVWWVPLASLADPALVETAAAQALGLEGHAVGDGAATSACCSCSTTSSICSTRPPASPRRSAPVRSLTVLVTSREPLHVDGEWEVAVDPLREREAVDLFVQRAAGGRLRLRGERRGRRDLQAPRLPAARDRAGRRAREGALARRCCSNDSSSGCRCSPAALGRRPSGSGRCARRSPGATTCSTPAEQDLFARLAVFAGGCTLEAAEEICGADLDAIASLVDKSLLRRTRRPLLDARDDSRVRGRAARGAPGRRASSGTVTRPGTSRSASARVPSCGRDGGREWLDRLDAEHANLRAALEHLLACEDADGALRLVGAIWHVLGDHAGTGPRAGASSTSAARARRRRRPRAPRRCVVGRGDPGAVAGRRRRGRADGRRACWSSRAKAGLPRGEADRRADACDRPQRARRSRRRRIASVRGVAGARPRRGRRLAALGRDEQPRHLFISEGDYERAIELFEESLAIGEARGDLDRRARELTNLALLRSRQGDIDGTRELCRLALAAAVEVGVVAIEEAVLSGLAECEAEAGNAEVAARLLGRSDALRSMLGAAQGDDGDRERTLALTEAAIGPDRVAAALAAGAAMSREDALDLALGRESTTSGDASG